MSDKIIIPQISPHFKTKREYNTLKFQYPRMVFCEHIVLKLGDFRACSKYHSNFTYKYITIITRVV